MLKNDRNRNLFENSLVDERQSSGRFAPVFKPLLGDLEREERYIQRMIARDERNSSEFV